MKFFYMLAIFASLLFSSICAVAENSAWSNSYQLETAGKYSAAITALDSVPANGPDAEYKTLRKAWLLYISGSYDDSIREYRYAIERNSKSIDARLGITLPMLAAKRWREAEQYARAVLNGSPGNYTALLRLDIALEGQKNWNEMAKVSQELVASYPTDASAYVYLARAKAWQNRVSDAAAAYSAVLIRVPGHVEALNYLAKR